MKKPVCLLIVCFLSGMIYAQDKAKKEPNGAVDNPALRKSKKEQQKQAKEFETHKRYSSEINSHRAKQQRKQQAKSTGNGKG